MATPIWISNVRANRVTLEDSYTEGLVNAKRQWLGKYSSLVQVEKSPPRLELVSLLSGSAAFVIDNFILIGSNETAQEKVQVIETFGPAFLFSLGKKARIFTYSILLLNDVNNNWKNKLLSLWDRALSSSQALSLGLHAKLTYDGTTRFGQIIALDARTQGETQLFTQASFSMFITRSFPVIPGDSGTRPNGFDNDP